MATEQATPEGVRWWRSRTADEKREMAYELGTSVDNLSRVINGTREASRTLVILWCLKYPDVRPEWLRDDAAEA